MVDTTATDDPFTPAEPYTLWRGTEPLGTVDLGPLGTHGSRTGLFHPLPAFDAVWPVYAALQVAQTDYMAAMPRIPPGTPADTIRAQFQAVPGHAAFLQAIEAVRALGVELRDPTGAGVAEMEVGIRSYAVPIPDDLTPEQRAQADAELREANVPARGYLLVAVPRPR